MLHCSLLHKSSTIDKDLLSSLRLRFHFFSWIFFTQHLIFTQLFTLQIKIACVRSNNKITAYSYNFLNFYQRINGRSQQIRLCGYFAQVWFDVWYASGFLSIESEQGDLYRKSSKVSNTFITIKEILCP